MRRICDRWIIDGAAGSRPMALALALVSATVSAAPAQDAAPLSAIDWLRHSPIQPQPGAYPVTPPLGAQPGDPGISVRALDALRPEAVGLFPAARVGLPTALWGPTPAGTLAGLIAALPTDMLPALRDLSLRMLLAEFNAPLPDAQSASPQAAAAPDYLLARIDKLVEFGALDQAAAILDTLGAPDPRLRLLRFDIGLLLGDEHAACTDVLRPEPPIGDDAALVFCLSRAGEWDAADARLTEAADAGRVTPYLADLLAHFLNDDARLPGASTLIPPPTGTPDPLVWRLREATGETESTLGLPVAYAHADLRGTIGWRAQIEAAERLVRAGALSPNRLLGLYTGARGGLGRHLGTGARGAASRHRAARNRRGRRGGGGAAGGVAAGAGGRTGGAAGQPLCPAAGATGAAGRGRATGVSHRSVVRCV